jgi:hypothetical protein
MDELQDRELDPAQTEGLAHHANERLRGPDRSLRKLIPEQAVHAPFVEATLGREVVCLTFVAIHRVILTVAVIGALAGKRLITFA